MGVTYHYWRHHSQYTEEYESLPKALAQARHDAEYMDAAPEKIVLEDGTELGEEEILERSGYYADVDVKGIIIDSTVEKS